jgi:hypothetical protein
MEIRARASAAASLLVLASLFVPAIADAGSRRNYADEWRQEEREEEYREEQQQQMDDWQEHQDEQNEKYYEHQEKQLDTVVDHLDRTYGNPPAAPAPKKSGTCIYGADNQVIHQPDGVVCDKK